MKGIDIVIEKQRLMFAAYLWTGNNCSWYGRCQTNYRNDKAVPEVLNAGTNNYTEVLFDDTKDAISFFDVLPDRTEDLAIIDIYFAVKLSKLFPSVTERASEWVLADVIKRLHQGGLFIPDKTKSITDGYEAWKQWSMVKKEDNMQPFYLFKVKTNVQYVLTC